MISYFYLETQLLKIYLSGGTIYHYHMLIDIMVYNSLFYKIQLGGLYETHHNLYSFFQ